MGSKKEFMKTTCCEIGRDDDDVVSFGVCFVACGVVWYNIQKYIYVHARSHNRKVDAI